jgi:hypothetical protein
VVSTATCSASSSRSAFQHLASGGQFGGFRLRLHQTALDLAACLRCGPLDLGGNGSGQCLRQFRRSGCGHRAGLAPRGQRCL